MNIRTLEPHEYEKVLGIFQENGSLPPLPEHSLIKVAEDEEGEIIGMFVKQVVIHGEPIWVREDHRGNGLAGELIQAINKTGGPYYSFAPTNEVEQLCRSNGMKELPWKVFLKE